MHALCVIYFSVLSLNKFKIYIHFINIAFIIGTITSNLNTGDEFSVEMSFANVDS